MAEMARGYGQFCPVAKAAEIFAERWTPLILRELGYGGCRFAELQQGLPGISQSLLTQRLRSLERDGIIQRRALPGKRGAEYWLTAAGAEFGQAVEALGIWGQRWATAHLRADDLDPGLLMWFLRRRVQVDQLPAARIVVRVELRRKQQPSRSARPVKTGQGTWWLVLNRPEVELCLKDPGWETDLCVQADLEALTQVYLGRLGLRDAMRRGLVTVEGPRDLAHAFPEWIGVSAFAPYAGPPQAALAG